MEEEAGVEKKQKEELVPGMKEGIRFVAEGGTALAAGL